MSRTILNFWLDSLLLVTFLGGLWATLVMRFVFPAGTQADGWTLWGMTYDQWSNGQFWIFSFLAAAVLVHVMLHWTWVCGVITTRFLSTRHGKRRQWQDGERTLVGVGLLVVIFNVLGLAFAAAVLMVQRPV